MALYPFPLVVIEPPADLFLITSNNKIRQHLRKMFSVDCQFTSGPCHFSKSLKSRLNRDMEQKQQSPCPPCLGSIWTSESQSQSSFPPNSFSTMGEITPTTSLYLLWKYQRVGEPDALFKIHNNREYPRQFGRGAMNE